ncbi:hypothetical protein LVD13_13275 [Flavobacteriaceae bacterium D16]|nr:hypothetical protein [Flavobacteriaceae bacterium D16]
MKNYSIIRLFVCIVLIQSCQQDDVPSTPDPNLFLGSWKLSSSTFDGAESMEINDCTKNSILLLYRFSEDNPSSNAELYDYALNETGECIVVQSIIQATWYSETTFTNTGNISQATVLRYITQQGETVNLTLERVGEFLTATGNATLNESDTTINRTYIKLGQEFP